MIKLQEAIIHQYRCIEKEQIFDVKDDITIFIGRNEAGKTTLLEALAKANYFDRSNENYSYSPLSISPDEKKESWKNRTRPRWLLL
ncbi:AAA family ATPase [Eubacteriaceae bacterium ES2]|nr:AAA family ATPase [Eubacteriaceae bacterium ES2]